MHEELGVPAVIDNQHPRVPCPKCPSGYTVWIRGADDSWRYTAAEDQLGAECPAHEHKVWQFNRLEAI